MHPHDVTPLDDTTKAAEAFLIERLRSMSARDKLELVRRLNRGLIALSAAGVRSRHPSIDAQKLALRVAALRLPREIMVRVFDWDPEREGY